MRRPTTIYNNNYRLWLSFDRWHHVGGTITNIVVRNNIVYKCGGGITDEGTGTVKSNNLVNVDPEFVIRPLE